MKQVPIAEFKSHCSRYVHEVSEEGPQGEAHRGPDDDLLSDGNSAGWLNLERLLVKTSDLFYP